jgi:hypothetical protein
MEAVHQFYNILVLQVTQCDHFLLHHFAVNRPSLYAQNFNCNLAFINLIVHQVDYSKSPLPKFLFELELVIPDLVVEVFAKRVKEMVKQGYIS